MIGTTKRALEELQLSFGRWLSWMRQRREAEGRLKNSAQLWHELPQTKLIMSTGDDQRLGITNARQMADYAAGLGVPRQILIQEDGSWNTCEYLVHSMDIVQAEGLKQPTLVTLDLYSRRAVATGRELGWKDFPTAHLTRRQRRPPPRGSSG